MIGRAFIDFWPIGPEVIFMPELFLTFAPLEQKLPSEGLVVQWTTSGIWGFRIRLKRAT